MKIYLFKATPFKVRTAHKSNAFLISSNKAIKQKARQLKMMRFCLEFFFYNSSNNFNLAFEVDIAIDYFVIIIAFSHCN